MHLELPITPGIYRFYNENQELIYVGKAKNLRRRISQYRNAKRCKAHGKMRKIVAEATHFEHQTCETELDALKLENQWIQEHRPKWNVAGAFFFLYPMVGIHLDQGMIYFCYTTTPEFFPAFQFHGAFRSRYRTLEGFFSLMELMRLIGYAIPRNHLVKSGLFPAEPKKGYLYGFRQVPEAWQKLLEAFFRGDDFGAIKDLSVLLLDRPSAVANAKETQDHLRAIRRFWRHEILSLKKAREFSNWEAYPVSQKDRDLIFITLKTGL